MANGGQRCDGMQHADAAFRAHRHDMMIYGETAGGNRWVLVVVARVCVFCVGNPNQFEVCVWIEKRCGDFKY